MRTSTKFACIERIQRKCVFVGQRATETQYMETACERQDRSINIIHIKVINNNRPFNNIRVQ